MRHRTPRHVFVYGTLRSGEARDINRLHPLPLVLGIGSIAGQLYDLGSYPGVRLGGAGRVAGEVYAISAELERRLDEIEEVWPKPSGEYVKQEVEVRLNTPLDNGSGPGAPAAAGLRCLVYEATQEAVLGRPAIKTGDWVAYRQRLR